jgi:hypothetical protein
MVLYASWQSVEPGGWDEMDQHNLRRNGCVTPIFAVLSSELNAVVYVNETDLGYRAENRGESCAHPFMTSRDIVKSSGPVVLHQPDQDVPLKVSRSSLNLDLNRVRTAIQRNRDWSRILVKHEKRFVELPTGELGLWIQVYHQWMQYDYWNGLLYVVRNHKPVILASISGAKDIDFIDLDGDGTEEIVRLGGHHSSQFNPLGRVRWQAHRWDEKRGAYVIDPQASSWGMMAKPMGLALLVLLPLVLLLAKRFCAAAAPDPRHQQPTRTTLQGIWIGYAFLILLILLLWVFLEFTGLNFLPAFWFMILVPVLLALL